MSSMTNQESMPKKVPPRQFKTNPKHRPEQKRSVSINISTTNKLHKRNKTSNSPHRSDSPKEDKDIQTDPEPSPVTHQLPIISSLPETNKISNLRQSALHPFSNNKTAPQLILQDFQRDFLLRERAKRFILKMKKQKKESDKKMSQIKEKLGQHKQKKIQVQEMQRKMKRQQQLVRKRERVGHMLRQLEFNRERRLQQKRRKLFQEQMASRLQVYPELQIQAMERQQLDQILNKSPKRIVSPPKQIKISNPKKALPQKKSYDNQDLRKGQSHSKRAIRNKIKDTREGQISTGLQKHLYLSLQDENLLERIKQNMDKLQSLRSSDILSSKSNRKLSTKK